MILTIQSVRGYLDHLAPSDLQQASTPIQPIELPDGNLGIPPPHISDEPAQTGFRPPRRRDPRPDGHVLVPPRPHDLDGPYGSILGKEITQRIFPYPLRQVTDVQIRRLRIVRRRPHPRGLVGQGGHGTDAGAFGEGDLAVLFFPVFLFPLDLF